MLDQLVTLRVLKVDNPPEPAEGQIRYRGELDSSVETIVYRGAVFPAIHYDNRSAMVEVRDFDSGSIHYHFNVVDVSVVPLNEDRSVQGQVGAYRR